MNNTNIWQSQQKKKQPTFTNDSILESLRNLGSGVGKTVTRDVLGKGANVALRSFFGTVPQSGDLTANEAVTFPRQPKEVQRIIPRRPEINLGPVREKDQILIREELAKVRVELKALSAAIKNFNQDVQKAIEEIPVNPGIYHVTFMERLRGILMVLREQIEDSRAWLSLTANRKKKKMYWGLYKKHGTQFGLSSERTLATQAG